MSESAADKARRLELLQERIRVRIMAKTLLNLAETHPPKAPTKTFELAVEIARQETSR
jgi:hypothetical protein